MNAFEPSYVALWRSGLLRERVVEAVKRLEACAICPRACGVDRTSGEVGHCRTGRLAKVASFGPHYGEERPLVARGGSGTIFFSCCNLDCVFCQNWEISHLDEGAEVDPEELCAMMLALQKRGCENINLVSPTHVVPQILEALELAVEKGLRLPLVYNTGGYDSLKTLALLDGVVDIYMPDAKYSSNAVAARYSGVPDYVDRNRAAILEMHRQVGDLVLDERGVAVRGLLVRHLVLPAGLAGTEDVVLFLARQVSPNTYVNIMDQYRPAGMAALYPELDRRLAAREYARALAAACAVGLTRLDQ